MSEHAGHSARIAGQKYLDTREAAAIVRKSPRTLERLRLTGLGPPYRKPGKGLRSKVLYRLADLEAWVEGASFASTSEYEQARP
jgi:hypothetical protein